MICWFPGTCSIIASCAGWMNNACKCINHVLKLHISGIYYKSVSKLCSCMLYISEEFIAYVCVNGCICAACGPYW